MECNDVNCPIHGTLAARGQIIEGVVVSDKMQKTVVVQRNYFVKVRKYERVKKARSRIPAHNPPCINAKEGDNVRIMECRKLGKTVSFVVMEKLGAGKVAEVKEKTEATNEIPEEKKSKKKVKVKNG